MRWYGLLEQDGSPMEGMGVYRINGNLAVARAIGDRSERPFVSSEFACFFFNFGLGYV